MAEERAKFSVKVKPAYVDQCKRQGVRGVSVSVYRRGGREFPVASPVVLSAEEVTDAIRSDP